MSTLKQQGTKAFIWDFTGKMAMHGMGFVVSIFLARLLEPSDFELLMSFSFMDYKLNTVRLA